MKDDDMIDKKEKLKKLFYSDLNEFELKQELGLTHVEYRNLLNQVKIELGLPTSYHRNPNRFGLYSPKSYYILHEYDDDYDIVKYYPTRELAEYDLKEYMSTTNRGVYLLGYASDENMKQIIHDQYFNKKNNWETIMQKCKIPYHNFYSLLKEVKREANKEGCKTLKDKRYIYKYNPTNKYVIRRFIRGKYRTFGYYATYEEAETMRDYLEKINWNVELYKQTKEDVIKNMGVT